MSLGTTISRLRAERNLSQGDLAEALGVSRQSVSKWETDSSVPELDKLVRLSQVFGVTLDELVTGAPPENGGETPPPPPPAPAAGGIPGRKIAGFVLLVMAFLTVLACTVAGGMLEGLILCIPFLLCGCVCLIVRRYPGLWCGWALYVLFSVYLPSATGITWSLIFLTPVYTPQMNYLRLAFAWLLVLLALLLVGWTAFRYRKGAAPSRRTALAAAGALILFFALPCLQSLLPGPFLLYVLLDDLRLLLLACLATAAVRWIRARRGG